MQKFFVVFLCLLSGLIVSGAEFTAGKLSESFSVYYRDGLSEKEALALAEGTAPEGCTPVTAVPENGFVDLAALLKKKKLAEKTTALVSMTYTAESDGKALFGVGAECWMVCYINGKRIHAQPLGNMVRPVSVYGEPFSAAVQKGENKIVLLVQSATSGWSVAFAPLTRAQMNRGQSPDFRPNPWITHSAVGTATVNFITKAPAIAFVEYRMKGETSWQREYELLGGQPRHDLTKHTIVLTGLKPDADYEYRCGAKQKAHGGKEIVGRVRTFRSFTDQPVDFKMFYISDTQFPADRRIGLLKNYFKNCAAGEADILIHGGDIYNYFFDAAPVYLDSFLDVVVSALPDRSQTIAVTRGNHEYWGYESQEFFRYFGGRENKSYGMFRQGNVCFILLDSGDDRGYNPKSPWHARNFTEKLMQEQREWLTEAVTKPEFQTATFRVVLLHSPGNEPYMGESIRKMTDGILTGSAPAHKVQLWICSHTHRYSRSAEPGKAVVRSFDEKTAVLDSPLLPHGVVVINDGPSFGGYDENCIMFQFRKDEIEAKAMTSDGNVFDHFSVLADGTLKEHSTNLNKISRP